MGTIFRRSLGFLVLALAGLGWSALSAHAQEPKNDQDKPPDVLPIWRHEFGFDLQATATMLAAGDACRCGGSPFGPLGTRVLLGEEALLKARWRFDFMDFVPALPAHVLRLIEDKRPLPKPAEHDLDLHLKDADFNWYKTYVYAVAHTHEIEEQRFKNSAFNFRNVAYADLLARAPQYRGKIITVKGKLNVVRKEAAPRQSRRFVADLPNIYNGWITTETYRAPPFVVVLTELPAELEDAGPPYREVTFVGYFLSLVKFPTDKAEKHQNCPYLVGKIIEVKELPKEAEKPTPGIFSYYLIVTVLGGIVVVAGAIVVINLWLRRNDARIEEKLAEVRYRTNPFNLEPEEPAPEGTPPPSQPPDSPGPPQPGH